MRNIKSVQNLTFLYFIMTALSLGGLLLPWEIAQVISVGAAVVSFAFGFAEAKVLIRLYRIELQKSALALDLMTPDIKQEQLKFDIYRAMADYAEYIQKMTPQQLAYASFMVPDLFDDWGDVRHENDHYYTRDEAVMVISILSENKYGYIYLPALWMHKRGTRLYNTIQAVTHDLIASGAAQRENGKRNNRAYLLVSPDDALVHLYPHLKERTDDD